MPKGVLWRQADIFVASMGGRNLANGAEWASLDEIVAAAEGGGARLLPAPPFMHGAGHWLALNAMNGGNTVCIQDDTVALDAVDVWQTVAREQVNILLIVGDAFARPLVDELEMAAERGEPHATGSQLPTVSGGAPLHSPLTDTSLDQLPPVMGLDAVVASDTGRRQCRVKRRHDE